MFVSSIKCIKRQSFLTLFLISVSKTSCDPSSSGLPAVVAAESGNPRFGANTATDSSRPEVELPRIDGRSRFWREDRSLATRPFITGGDGGGGRKARPRQRRGKARCRFPASHLSVGLHAIS